LTRSHINKNILNISNCCRLCLAYLCTFDKKNSRFIFFSRFEFSNIEYEWNEYYFDRWLNYSLAFFLAFLRRCKIQLFNSVSIHDEILLIFHFLWPISFYCNKHWELKIYSVHSKLYNENPILVLQFMSIFKFICI